MKKIRKISGNPVFVIMLTFAFLFASCSEEAVVPNQIEAISGKELFKSIVFADGSLTAKIPALQNVNITKNLSSEQLVKFRTFQNKAIDYLESTDENYFKNFKASILTKDVEVISKTLSDSSKNLEPVIATLAQDENISLDELKSLVANNKSKSSSQSKNPDDLACLLIVIVLLVWYWCVKDIKAAKGSNAFAAENGITNTTVSAQLVDLMIE